MYLDEHETHTTGKCVTTCPENTSSPEAGNKIMCGRVSSHENKRRGLANTIMTFGIPLQS